MSGERKSHWEQVYATKAPTEVSWYQPTPERSLQLIADTGVDRDEPILDAGGGASTLVDNLLDAGYSDITVLDIAGSAIERSRKRLGGNADHVKWIESDVTDFKPVRRYALWHDRAVFHFLTESDDRRRYADTAWAALRDDGHLVIATFGPEGPQRCSGLEICRYDIEQLHQELGRDFRLRRYDFEEHRTPGGSPQQFLYAWFQKSK